MKTIPLAILFVVAAMIPPSTVLSAVAVLNSNDPAFWNTHAFVVCKVEKIIVSPGTTQITALVMAVAMTEVLVPTDLVMKGALNVPESALRANIEKGSVVLACIEQKEGDWILPSNGIGFFPEGCALQIIHGLDDPRLDILLKAAHEAKGAAYERQSRREN